MAEYINKDEFLKQKCEYCDSFLCEEHLCYVEHKIKDMSTIDIVRCKECIHHINHCCYNPKAYHMSLGAWTVDDYFCADGERKEQ